MDGGKIIFLFLPGYMGEYTGLRKDDTTRMGWLSDKVAPRKRWRTIPPYRQSYVVACVEQANLCPEQSIKKKESIEFLAININGKNNWFCNQT
jgi:hypothetical protein